MPRLRHDELALADLVDIHLDRAGERNPRVRHCLPFRHIDLQDACSSRRLVERVVHKRHVVENDCGVTVFFGVSQCYCMRTWRKRECVGFGGFPRTCVFAHQRRAVHFCIVWRVDIRIAGVTRRGAGKCQLIRCGLSNRHRLKDFRLRATFVTRTAPVRTILDLAAVTVVVLENTNGAAHLPSARRHRLVFTPVDDILLEAGVGDKVAGGTADVGVAREPGDGELEPGEFKRAGELRVVAEPAPVAVRRERRVAFEHDALEVDCVVCRDLHGEVP